MLQTFKNIEEQLDEKVIIGTQHRQQLKTANLLLPVSLKEIIYFFFYDGFFLTFFYVCALLFYDVFFFYHKAYSIII